jgi:hypothetical protein
MALLSCISGNPRWYICTSDTYVPFQDGTYVLAAHMCYSEMAHIFWQHICTIPRWHICTGGTYVPFQDGTYVLAAHMCHSEMAHMYCRHICAIPRWDICTGGTYVPFRDGTYVLAAHMCHSEMAHMYWRHILYVPFRDGKYVLATHMCRSKMAHMYRGTYMPFRDGTYVPQKKIFIFYFKKKFKKWNSFFTIMKLFWKFHRNRSKKVALVTSGLSNRRDFVLKLYSLTWPVLCAKLLNVYLCKIYWDILWSNRRNFVLKLYRPTCSSLPERLPCVSLCEIYYTVRKECELSLIDYWWRIKK